MSFECVSAVYKTCAAGPRWLLQKNLFSMMPLVRPKRIIILGVSLYSEIVCKIRLKLKLGNDTIYIERSAALKYIATDCALRHSDSLPASDLARSLLTVNSNCS